MREKNNIYWPIFNCSGLDDPYVYINKVGTFGLACASYWWSRIAGSGVRLVHELLGPQMPIELFFLQMMLRP